MFTTVNAVLSKVLTLILIKVVLCNETVDVELKQGVLSGTVEKTFFKQQNYYSFKGVPYAEPPVGKLRFQPPKAHTNWEGTYEAFTNKPTCMQFNSRMRNNEPFGLSGSEDCLYLSIFTPRLEGPLPVVVFDYNDSFRTGFNGTRTYSPEFFIEEDVIVITISHRLGPLGYLTTEDDVIPGNNGLRDFLLGLEWIKENIQNFGGDPERVTLMGSQGGAVLADLLLYSKKAKGLFSAVILQSGTALDTGIFHDTPSKKAFELGELFDIKTDDSKVLLQELQNIEVEKIMTEEFKIMDGDSLKEKQMSVFPSAPTVEKDCDDAVLSFIPDKQRIVNDVPVLIGMNSRLGLDLASHFIFQPKLVDEVADHHSIYFPIRSGFRFDSNSTVYKQAMKEINDFYYTDGYLYHGNILEYAVYIGDILQNYALDFAAKKYRKDLGSPVFYYVFDFRGSLNENSEYMTKYCRFSMKHWGATVVDELCYLHLCSRIKKTYEQLTKLPSEQPEIKLLKKMVRLWTNFAKTRNPTPDKEKDNILKNVTWHPIDKKSKDINYLHISKHLKMKTNPLGERAEFWDNFLDKYSKMAVDGLVKDANENRDEL